MPPLKKHKEYIKQQHGHRTMSPALDPKIYKLSDENMRHFKVFSKEAEKFQVPNRSLELKVKLEPSEDGRPKNLPCAPRDFLLKFNSKLCPPTDENKIHIFPPGHPYPEVPKLGIGNPLPLPHGHHFSHSLNSAFDLTNRRNDYFLPPDPSYLQFLRHLPLLPQYPPYSYLSFPQAAVNLPAQQSCSQLQITPETTLERVASSSSRSSRSSSESGGLDGSVRSRSTSSSTQVPGRKKRRQDELIPEGCPLTKEEIVNSEIDAFNESMDKKGLTESQKTEMRELRRKGKNRFAARKSREKKLKNMDELYQELNETRALQQRRIIELEEVERKYDALKRFRDEVIYKRRLSRV